jgi:hypothetical protein
VVHKLPTDLREALIANDEALAAWKDITPLARNEFICWVEDAKPLRTKLMHRARPYAAAMGMVDPDDDSICRWVVLHFRYDPDRKERRNVVVAAFDNPEEFDADMTKRAAQLRAGKQRGDVDAAENITGQIHEPGYRHTRQNARLLRRAVQHGVFPTRIEHLELPPHVAVAQARRSPGPASTAK